MGIVLCCCPKAMPPHGPLEVAMPKSLGVGRLDHHSLEESVREDVVRLMTRDFLGADEQNLHPLMEWVFGEMLSPEGRLSFATHMARMLWEETVDYCGGFALGMRDSNGQLGAVALLVPVEPNQRRSVYEAVWRCHCNFRFWKYSWWSLGKARSGVQMRARSFHEIRNQHLGNYDMFAKDQSVLCLRLLVGAYTEEAALIKVKLLRVVCYYADSRQYAIATHGIRDETIRQFESLDFEVNKQVLTNSVRPDPDGREPLYISDLSRSVQWPPCTIDW